MKLKFYITFLSISIIFAFVLVLSVSEENPWKKILQKDIDKVADIVHKNHPGMLEEIKNDFGFKKNFDKALQNAQERSKLVASYIDYKHVIQAFVNSFHDEHLSLSFTQKESTESFYWPGFLVRYNPIDQEFYACCVDYTFNTDDILPEEGARLISCDGIDPYQVMIRDVFSYRSCPFYTDKHDHKMLYESGWIKSAPYLFVRDGSIFSHNIKKCVFEKNRKKQTINLTWNKLESLEVCRKACNHKASSFGIKCFHHDKDSVWITIPTFMPQSKKEISFFNTILEQLKDLRNKKIIVFDVRGNGGGNSQWADKIIKSLYGGDTLSKLQQNTGKMPTSLYRLSYDNIISWYNHWSPLIKENFGKDSQEIKSLVDQKNKFLKALKTGNNLYKMSYNDEAISFKKIPSSIKTNVFVLTDHTCASATLDFLSKMLCIDNVTHIGQPTARETVYTEWQPYNLPSSLCTLNCPRKMLLRYKVRGHDGPYQPKYLFTGNMSNRQALEKWVESIISK